jgi:uncharacterized protein
MSKPGQLIASDEQIGALLHSAKVVAVLGIKTDAAGDQPAYYVPEAVQGAGYKVIPVPVYYPEATKILGQPVFRSVLAIGEPIDIVDVFRRAKDLAAHVDDLLAAKPGCVWLQSGIRDAGFTKRMLEAGIDVVEDRCMMVEVKKHGPRPRA